MKKELPQKMEETLNSLDGLQRAEAGPFLYSKIRNRLQSVKEAVPQNLAWRMIAALAIVALLNVLTLRHSNAEQRTDSGAQSVADEYSIALPQTY